MNYQIVMKDGTKQDVTADTYERVIPRYVFMNFVVKGGRKVDEVVTSVAIDDITTILLVTD